MTTTFKTASVLLLPLLFISGCQQQDESGTTPVEEIVRPAKLLTISSAALGNKRSFPGQIKASRHSDLAFRVSGQLVKLPAQAGVEVNKGDLLAQLDTTDFRHSLAERKAALDLAQTRYDQTEKMFKKAYTTQAALNEVTANLKSAKAAVAIARDNLHYTSLKAPFSGVIARVDAKNYQTISAQKPLIRVHNIENLDVSFTVPETLLTQFNQTAEASKDICADVHFTSLKDKTYKACFKEFEGVPDTVTRGYRVVFTMPPITDFPVLPGMSVLLDIDFTGYLNDSNSKVILVPLSAVFERENKSWVWKLDSDNRVQQSEVSVAKIEDGELLITAGLQDDDTIVVTGVNRIRQGQAIRPLTQERGI